MRNTRAGFSSILTFFSLSESSSILNVHFFFGISIGASSSGLGGGDGKVAESSIVILGRPCQSPYFFLFFTSLWESTKTAETKAYGDTLIRFSFKLNLCFFFFQLLNEYNVIRGTRNNCLS